MCSHGVVSNLITSYFVMFWSMVLSLYKSVGLMDQCMWCTRESEWVSTFPFWTTDQYCSSVNIISFFRLIQLKRDELGKRKDGRRKRSDEELAACALFYIIYTWGRQKKTPISIQLINVYLWRCLLFSILFDSIMHSLFVALCFADWESSRFGVEISTQITSR